MKIVSTELFQKEVLELKQKKDQKQEKDRPKYTRMHLDEKNKVKMTIQQGKLKIEEIRKIVSFDSVEQQAKDCDEIITLLYNLRDAVKHI